MAVSITKQITKEYLDSLFSALGVLGVVTSTALNIPSGGSVTIDVSLSGISNVTDVTVFEGTDDITDGVEIDVIGGNVTVSSNVNLTNIIIKINGN